MNVLLSTEKSFLGDLVSEREPYLTFFLRGFGFTDPYAAIGSPLLADDRPRSSFELRQLSHITFVQTIRGFASDQIPYTRCKIIRSEHDPMATTVMIQSGGGNSHR